MRILISGQHGQVSTELQHHLKTLGELVVPGRAEFDLTDPQQLRQQVRRVRPDLIINAAAYTAVDQAENESQVAFAINATAPGILAEEAAQLGIALIHYSTDYVFDGTKKHALQRRRRAEPAGRLWPK